MFFGPHNMKMSHHFISLWYPLKLGTFLIFWRPPPLFGLISKFGCFFDWKASLSHLIYLYSSKTQKMKSMLLYYNKKTTLRLILTSCIIWMTLWKLTQNLNIKIALKWNQRNICDTTGSTQLRSNPCSSKEVKHWM